MENKKYEKGNFNDISIRIDGDQNETYRKR